MLMFAPGPTGGDPMAPLPPRHNPRTPPGRLTSLPANSALRLAMLRYSPIPYRPIGQIRQYWRVVPAEQSCQPNSGPLNGDALCTIPSTVPIGRWPTYRDVARYAAIPASAADLSAGQVVELARPRARQERRDLGPG